MQCALRVTAVITLLCALSGSAPATAQNDGTNGPPKVLVIQREYLKPGKGGATHEKSESAFVKAFTGAHYPTHYFAMDSLSGPSRTLFLVGYGSFAAWEQDTAMQRKNTVLSAGYDKAQLMDGELLSAYDSGTFMLREDLSLNSRSIKNARYFEIILFLVKPGHTAEFEQLGKMYGEGYKKVPGAHWDVFQLVYGAPSPTPGGDAFLVVRLMDSLREVDQGMADDRKFAEGMGAGAMKKLEEITASSVAAISTNLFEINPRISYPEKQWVDDDPGFWKVAPAPAMKKSTKPVKTGTP